jgi:signal transduction histidine kinase
MARRFVLAFLGLTVVVLVVLIVPLGISATDRERDRLTLDLERDARAIGSFAEDTLEGIADEDLQAAADRYADRTGARVLIIDDAGRSVADSADTSAAARDFSTRPEVADALAGRLVSGTRRSDTLDTDLLYVAVPVASGGEVHGVVRLTYPTQEVDDRVREVWLTLAGVAAVSLVAAGALATALARSVTRPLRELEGAATAMGAGDLTSRAPQDRGPPEVRALARAFNETSRRLEELVDAQDAFVADASHQLRTPLTALRLRLENLAAVVDDDVSEVDAALAEVGRLSRLVDGLLALARADRAAAAATAEDIDVTALVQERREIWLPVAEDRGVDLVLDGPTGVVARATPDRLAQSLDNLIDNAVEASPVGTTIRLVIEHRPEGARIHVRDEGPGMTVDQREHAFDRFWQGPAGSGSTGLGLAIVRKLVLADGGRVELCEADGGGLDARIELLPPATH